MKYLVTLGYTISCEADNEEDAEQIALTNFDNGLFDREICVFNIEERENE